jgi:hypothetical protein
MSDAHIPDVLRQLLMKRLGGNGSDLHDVLANHTDPLISGLAQQFKSASANQINAEAGDIVDETAAEPRSASQPNAQDALRARFETIRTENKRLLEINDLLAAALGACRLCWGDDPECHECGGNGIPGGAVPRQPLFAKYVLPALRRRREERQRTATPVHAVPRGR